MLPLLLHLRKFLHLPSDSDICYITNHRWLHDYIPDSVWKQLLRTSQGAPMCTPVPQVCLDYPIGSKTVELGPLRPSCRRLDCSILAGWSVILTAGIPLRHQRLGSLGHKILRDVKILEELYILRLITESIGQVRFSTDRRGERPLWCARWKTTRTVCQVAPSSSAVAAKCFPFI